jgi:hypothetical protein
MIDDDSYDKSYRRDRLDKRHKITNLTSPKKDTNTEKVQVTHPKEGIGKLFIQPLDVRKKKRKLGKIDQNESDNAEVGRMFGGGEGVSLVREETRYYQN